MNNYGTVVVPLDIKCKIYVGIENRIYIAYSSLIPKLIKKRERKTFIFSDSEMYRTVSLV